MGFEEKAVVIAWLSLRPRGCGMRAAAARGRQLLLKTFDSHFHVIDPRFPLVPNQGYLPPAFTAKDYSAAAEGFKFLSVRGGAVVSGSFQLFDQSYLVAALQELGPGYVGVTQLPLDEPVDGALVEQLSAQGVRAIRYNVTRGLAGAGGATDSTEAMRAQALAVHALAGWHAEFYIDCALLLEDKRLFSLLASLPAVVVDHVGFSAAGLAPLLRLLDCRAGKLKTAVKLTGFGRYLGSREELRHSLCELLRRHPDCLVFGSDLPSTRARVPFDEDGDVGLVRECVQDVCHRAEGGGGGGVEAEESLMQRIFWDNAHALYLAGRDRH